MDVDIAKLRQALEDTPEVYGEGLDPETRAGLLAALDEVKKLREALKGIDGYILHNHELFGEFDTTNAACIRVMVAAALNTDTP